MGDRPWLRGVRQAGAPTGGGPGRRAGKVAATPLSITILGDHQLKPHHICPLVLISCHAEVFPASRREQKTKHEVITVVVVSVGNMSNSGGLDSYVCSMK